MKIQVQLMEADVDYTGSEVLKSLCPKSDTARTCTFKAVLNSINTISKELGISEISENSSDLNHANLAEGLLERHPSICPSESNSACFLPML